MVATQPIVFAASPVPRMRNAPSVVSASTASAQVDAPASLAIAVTVAAATIAVDAAFAPRLMCAVNSQDLVSPVAASRAMQSPFTMYAKLSAAVAQH